MRKNFLKLSVLSLLLCGVCLSSASAESLDEALQSTFQSNPDILAQRSALKQQVENIELAKSARRPILNLQVEAGHTDATDVYSSFTSSYSDNTSNSLAATLVGSLLIYDGGQTPNAIAAAEAGYKAAKLQLQAYEQQILLSAVNVYINVLAQQDALALEKKNIEIANSQLKSAQIAFDEGAATIADLSTAEANVASTKARIAATEADLAAALEEYKVIVGHDAGQLASLVMPELPSSPEIIAEEAMRTSPSILAAVELERSAQFDLRRARSTQMPTISATISTTRSHDFDSDNNIDSASVGIKGTMPISTGGQISALERQAEAVLEQRGHQTTKVKSEIAQSAANAWAQYQAALATRDAMEKLVAAQKNANLAAETEFDLGANTILDKLEANQALFGAEINLNTARHNVILAAYNILTVMGRLHANTQVTASFETGDPAEAVVKPQSEEAKAVEELSDRWSRPE